MSTDVDLGKRRFLTASTSAVGVVGAGFVAVPFVKSMSPSARAQAAGAPVEANISKLQAGQMMTVEWRGKPVWIVRRTQETLDTLKTMDGLMSDPASAESDQPEYCTNAARSIKPEYLITVGICTHLGCSPTFRPEMAPADHGADWKGGFFCPCHGSKFDLAGRVYAGVPAPLNLVVPPHKYINDGLIVVGIDQGEA